MLSKRRRRPGLVNKVNYFIRVQVIIEIIESMII